MLRAFRKWRIRKAEKRIGGDSEQIRRAAVDAADVIQTQLLVAQTDLLRLYRSDHRYALGYIGGFGFEWVQRTVDGGYKPQQVALHGIFVTLAGSEALAAEIREYLGSLQDADDCQTGFTKGARDAVVYLTEEKPPTGLMNVSTRDAAPVAR